MNMSIENFYRPLCIQELKQPGFIACLDKINYIKTSINLGIYKLVLGGKIVPITKRVIYLNTKELKCVRCNSQVEDVTTDLPGIDGIQYILSNGSQLTTDHIVPKHDGGMNNPLNYQPMCYICNSQHKNGDLHDDVIDAYDMDHIWYVVSKYIKKTDRVLYYRFRARYEDLFSTLLVDMVHDEFAYNRFKQMIQDIFNLKLNVKARKIPSSNKPSYFKGVY